MLSSPRIGLWENYVPMTAMMTAGRTGRFQHRQYPHAHGAEMSFCADLLFLTISLVFPSFS